MDKRNKILKNVDELMDYIRGEYSKEESEVLYKALSQIREHEELKHLMEKLDDKYDQSEQEKIAALKKYLDLEKQLHEEIARKEHERNMRYGRFDKEYQWPQNPWEKKTTI